MHRQMSGDRMPASSMADLRQTGALDFAFILRLVTTKAHLRTSPCLPAGPPATGRPQVEGRPGLVNLQRSLPEDFRTVEHLDW